MRVERKISMQTVIDKHKSVGGKWFNDDEKKLFGSGWGKTAVQYFEFINNKIQVTACFVSSEQDFKGENRYYTIRRVNMNTGQFYKDLSFQRYGRLGQALDIMGRYVQLQRNKKRLSHAEREEFTRLDKQITGQGIKKISIMG